MSLMSNIKPHIPPKQEKISNGQEQQRWPKKEPISQAKEELKEKLFKVKLDLLNVQ